MIAEGSECCVYTPEKGYLESIGWNGITYSQTIEGAFSFPRREAAIDALEWLPSGSVIVDVESLLGKESEGGATIESKEVIAPNLTVKYNDKPLVWGRDSRDLDGLSDCDLLIELCHRVVDYHATSLKFHDCERGTLDEVMDNDNNYCRVREVVKHVLGIDLEYVEKGRAS